MTRKDLQENYNIIGENKDIQLFRKNNKNGIGYCGSVSLKNGKIFFNGNSYTDVDSLDNALNEWASTLTYPVDTYCPMYNDVWRAESRIIWYLTEKMGFEASYKGFERIYIKNIGPSFRLEFHISNKRFDESEKVIILSKYGGYTFRKECDNAEEGIDSINVIINTSVLEMAKDMVDIISCCPVGVGKEIDAYIPSNKNLFSVENVDFKKMMINALENQLNELKK